MKPQENTPEDNNKDFPCEEDASSKKYDSLTEAAGLRRPADWRTVIFVTLYYVLTYITWEYTESLGLFTVPMFLLLCLFSLMGATATHNTMHCSLFKREFKFRNNVFQMLLTLTYGHPVSTYVPGHNLSHHKFTQLRRDIMRTSKVKHKWHLLNFLLFQQTVVLDVLRSDINYLSLQHHLGRPFFVQAMKELVWLLAVQIVLLVLDWKKFFLFFYVPHLFAQWFIVSINLLQHDGCDIRPAGSKDGNITRNFTGGILNYLTMNNGYHGIHHIRPTMHWSDYPAAHEKEVVPFVHPNLNQNNIITYMYTAFINPGVRIKYDGSPVVFDDKSEGVDEDWIVYPNGITQKDIDFVGRVKLWAKTAMLLVLKVAISPTYSPVFKVV
jgi:fatty acid desaturase